MDSITHTLIGVGAARLVSGRSEHRPQLALAAAAASLLPDTDSVLALAGLSTYGLYHRMFSHSLIGLSAIALISATLAWGLAAVPDIRRFGWFVVPNLPRNGAIPSRTTWPMFLLAAGAAVTLHWCADAITGYGNIIPLWPWNRWEASLRAVSSFDTVIFVSTLGWHMLTRHLNWPRRKEALLTAFYCALLIIYVFTRWQVGPPTII